MASLCSEKCVEEEESFVPPSSADRSTSTAQHREFDYLERPSQDFFCPVSLELLLEPQLTSCCGHHLSLEVTQRLRRDGKSCPMCNGEGWDAVQDKYHRRRVHQVRVRCWHGEGGCRWEGEINELDKHTRSCEKRPWECEHCELKCTFGEGEENHWSQCPKFPEPCPNGCEVGSVERCGIEEHLKVCPLEPVVCEMKEFGCEVAVPRKDLADHMRENQIQHLTTMTALNLRLTKQLQQDSTEQMEKLQQGINHQKRQHNEMKAEVKKKILELKNTIDGQAQMFAEQKNTLSHVSILLDLLNTKASEQKRLHQNFHSEATEKFTEHKQMLNRLESTQVTEKKVSQVQTELIRKIAQLEHGVEVKLMRQEGMIASVQRSMDKVSTGVSIQGSQLAELQRQNSTASVTSLESPVKESSSCSGAEIFTFDNYSQWKGSDRYQISPPFYTHPRGYKLRLKITYHASPHNDIGAELFLMQGEYDKVLPRPVSINVRLEVLNQLGEQRHVVKVETCTWMKREKGNKTIHSNLMKYATLEREQGRVQFMVNDCLKFKIIVSVI